MNQLGSAKKPQVQNSGQPAAAAEERRCRTCDVPHDLSIDCPHFLILAKTKRAGHTLSLGGCLSCLTTNHPFTFKTRKEWFSSHSNDCDMSYICTVGGCANKEDYQKMHVILCADHLLQNKARIDDFQAANQKYANIQYYTFSSHLKEARNIADKAEEKKKVEVIPDVQDRPVLTMQRISDGKGGSLLVVYDSGAMTSGVTTSAAAKLGSKTVKKGPISYTVLGNDTRVNKGGIEAFELPLADGRLITISALAMDEATGYIPKYNTKEAFADLEAEFQGEEGKLPAVDDEVGGRPADLLIGAEYQHLFPQMSTVFSSSKGLSVGVAKLASASGNQGVLSGTHPSFNSAARAMLFMKEGPKFYADSEFSPSALSLNDIPSAEKGEMSNNSIKGANVDSALIESAAAGGQLCGPKVPLIDLSVAKNPCQAEGEKGGSIKKLQMLSGALKSVRHAQTLNFASRAAFKSLELNNASTDLACFLPSFFARKTVCYDRPVVCEEEKSAAAATVLPGQRLGEDLKETMLLSTIININAASTWKPPWPLQDKLAGLLNKPTVNSQTSGQTVFEKVDRPLDTKPPELSARAGRRGPNEHARDWDSREGIG